MPELRAAPSAAPTLVLVDGHSLAFRSYYAFAKGREGGLRTSTGIPTSVCYGFLKSLLEVIAQQKPEYVAVAFDRPEPTFRHDADPRYKEGRPETPEDFIPDVENLKALLAALNLPVIMVSGYEADDVIGTLACQARQEGYRVKILSGDRDLFQLVDTNHQITVLYLSSVFSAAARSGAAPQEFGPAEVEAKLGVLPDQVVDYKALCGDSSDNISGVKGVGPKTAVQLLKQFGTLEHLYASLDQVKGAVQKKLAAGKDDARHSQFLAQIALNVPLEVTLADCKLQGFDPDQVAPILKKLEFHSYLNQLEQWQHQLRGAPSPVSGTAASPRELVSQLNAEAEGDTWFFSADETDTAQASPAVVVQIIDTPAKLAQLVQTLQTCTDPIHPVAWDTETDSLSPRDAHLVGLGCCWQDNPGEWRGDRGSAAPSAGQSIDRAWATPTAIAYIPMGHTQGGNLDQALVLETLRPILENETYPKVLQNAKFDRLVLQFQGITLAGVVFDTMLASYVLNPERSHNLTDLSQEYLNISAQSYQDLVPKGKTIADLPVPEVATYCGLDAYTTFALVEPLRSQLLCTPALHTLLLDVEQPLEPVLAAMETTGIRIDQAYLKTLSQELAQELAQLEAQAYQAAGEIFNLGSPKQLSQILFTKLGLDIKKTRKTKLGYSTDAATLEKLQGDHPLIDFLLAYRTLAKLKSTYVDALPELVRADTQRVHTDFNQAITATGRLSSSNPNLQNIPIRTGFSRQIRLAFVPEPNWLLVTADYSQIELRILAHLSQEPRLVDAYRHNQDVHTLTAQLMLEKEEITPEERRLAKIINFGVIYGMGAQRFAREAGVSRTEAKQFIERFYDRYPAVFAYLQRMERQAIAQGYVETILGRRRYFQFDSRSLQKYRGKPLEEIADLDLNTIKMSQYDRAALRAAANAPIQGSSADLIKIAMVTLHQALQGCQARLLLQVHDELVLEVPPPEWEAVSAIVKTTMETALPLSIPLVVEIHTGDNWMSAK